jgi:TrmH family RNA methyltransferase
MSSIAGPREGGKIAHVELRFVLNRPRSSQNIGAAARALANTGAGSLYVVEPLAFDRAQAAKLAAGADEILDRMRVVRTLDEALGDCVDVVMTTGRPVAGALTPEETAGRLISSAGPAALVFGDEVRGLTNRDLRRAGAVATIPTAGKSSLNLAQAVLVFGYEILKARGRAALPPSPPEPVADERLLALLRERARALLLDAGFLNPQQPEVVLDELVSLARRARPSRREVELLLAAVAQLEWKRAR